jgi:hypothetical protein
LWFGIFRLGVWPDCYEGVQFSKDPEALNQFFRQMVPNTGPYSAEVNIAAVSECLTRLAKAFSLTHSQAGAGWRTAIKNDNIRAVVSFEPGGDFIFPEGEAPGSIELAGRTVTPPAVPLTDFMRLTKIPIIVYYGDNIPGKPSQNPGQEQWRAFLEVAKAWRDVINRHGGDVTIVHLPEIGVHGNTHFPMSDLNNAQIADLMSDWLVKKGSD